MFVLRLCIVLIVALAGCDSKPPAGTTAPIHALPSVTTLSPPTLQPSDQPVVLLRHDSHSLNPDAVRNQLNIAVWHDGRITWRAADAAVREGRIDPTRIQALFDRMHQEGVFGDGKVYYGNVGPDASYEVIEVRTHDRELVMRSWHELYGDGVRSIATANGIEILEGRDPSAVMAAQPEEYKRFVRIWSEIRSAVESWVPSEAEPGTDD